MVNVLYPLGKTSHHNDFEIENSIRLLRKFSTDKLHIIVAGQVPENIDADEVIQLPKQIMNRYKTVAYNLYNSLPEKFTVLMNDDFFVTQEFSFKKMPLYFDGTIKQRLKQVWINRTYYNNLKNSSTDENDLNFAVHFPMPIRDPLLFRLILSNILQDEKEEGISFRNLYGNSVDEKKEFKKDVKHNTFRGAIDSDWFSIGDAFLNEQGKKYILSL